MSHLKKITISIFSISLITVFMQFNIFAEDMSFRNRAPYDVTDMFTQINLFLENEDGTHGSDLKDLVNIPRNANVQMQVNYKIPSFAVINAKEEYGFKIAEILKLTEEIDFPITCPSGKTIANIKVRTDHTASITFTDYAKSEGYLEPDTLGDFFVGAQLDASKLSNEGDDKVDLITKSDGTFVGSYNLNLAIDPIKASINLLKEEISSLVDPVDKSKNILKWKITAKVDTDTEDTLIKDLTITDTLDSSLTLFQDNTNLRNTFQIIDSRGKTYEYDIDYTYVYDDAKKEFVISFSDKTPMKVSVNDAFTITYQSTFEHSAFEGAKDNKKEFKNQAKGDFTYKPSDFIKNDDGTKRPFDETKDMVGKEIEMVKAQSEIGRVYVEKDGQLSADLKKIDWTIYANKEATSVKNGEIIDTIPAGLTLDVGTLSINNTYVFDSSGVSLTNNSDLTSTLAIDFQILFGEMNKEYVIKYSTKIDTDYFDKNTNPNAINKVKFSGDGFLNGITKDKAVAVNAAVIDKGSSYDKTNHTISWDLNINNNKLVLKGENGNGFYVIEDTIPDGVTLVTAGDTFDPLVDLEIYDTSASPATLIELNTSLNEKVLTIQIPDGATDSAKSYQVKYKTTVDDPYVYAVNLKDKKSFTNIAKASVILPGGSNISNVSIAKEQPIESNVLTKSFVDYDYNTRIAKWSLTLNDNKMDITNAVVEDLLPEYTSYIKNSITITKMNRAGSSSNVDPKDIFVYDETTNKMVLSLGNINEKYTITYAISCLDELFDGVDENGNILSSLEPITLTNKAYISGLPIPEKIEVIAKNNTPIQQSLLEKNGSYQNGTAYMKWEVLINKNQIPMITPLVLEDQIMTGLDLDPDSIELYHAVFDKNGNATAGAKVSMNEYQVAYNTDKLFTFTFLNSVNTAFILKYHTDILDVSADKAYMNSIKVKGGMPSQQSDSGSVNSYAHSSGGTSSISYVNATLKKVDSEFINESLSNVSLSLEKDNSSMAYGPIITDANGYALFQNIRPGKYKIRENATLDDYMMSSDGYIKDELGKVLILDLKANMTNDQATFIVKNDIKRGKATLQKLDFDTNRPLDNTSFALYRESDDKEIAIQTTDISGNAVFNDLRYGTYKIKETQTSNTLYPLPSGYLKDEEGNEIILTLNDASPILNLKIYNEKLKGSFELYKYDSETNKALANAEFEVYRASDEEFITKGNTNEEGKLIFEKLPYDTYLLRESKAPKFYEAIDGYITNDVGNRLEIVIDENHNDAKSLSYSIKNISLKGTLKITKKDDNTELPLAKVGFKLCDLEKVCTTEMITDDNGVVLFEQLPYGEYTLLETKVPQGYKLPERDLTVLVNQTFQEITVTNQMKTTNLTIKKMDIDTDAPLKDAEIALIDATQEAIVRKGVTNEDGVTLFNEVPIGSYYLKELTAPDLYQLPLSYLTNKNKEQIKITVDGTLEQMQIHTYNEKYKGTLKIVKKDALTNLPLSQAKFQLCDSKQQCRNDIVSDAHGEATL